MNTDYCITGQNSSTKPLPRVSVLVNNYNYSRFLGEAIDSCLAQTYPEVEVVVVDDGSTDNSVEVIRRYGERIVPIFKSNGGQASTFNAGVKASTGDILCFLDSDDYFLPQKIERVVEIFNTYPDIGWCFHQLEIIGDMIDWKNIIRMKYKNYGQLDLRRYFKGYSVPISPPATSGLSLNRKLASRIFPMPEHSGISISDNYVKYAAMSIGAGYYCSDRLATQRIHGDNLFTGSQASRSRAAVIHILTAYEMKGKFCGDRFLNNMFAKGIALGVREVSPAISRKVSDYWNALSFIERCEIELLKHLHLLLFKLTQ